MILTYRRYYKNDFKAIRYTPENYSIIAKEFPSIIPQLGKLIKLGDYIVVEIGSTAIYKFSDKDFHNQFERTQR